MNSLLLVAATLFFSGGWKPNQGEGLPDRCGADCLLAGPG